MSSRRLALPLAALLLVAACSDDSSSSATTAAAVDTTAPADTAAPATDASSTEAPTTMATTTTVDPAELALTYSEYGPHPVGVVTLQLPNGTPVEVWYPAVAGSNGTEVVDLRSYVPPAIDALFVPDAPTTYSYSAARDAAVAEGAFPIVLFSHGASSVRVASTFITSNLASWGMIVLAPQHPSRDLFAALSGGTSGDRTDSVDDLLGALDLMTAQSADPASSFSGRADVERVAAVGHSAGGVTALLAADDPRIDGYVLMGSGILRGRSDDPGVTTTTVDVTMPDKPSFFIAGSVDAAVPWATVTEPAFQAAAAPSTLWVIEGAGHSAFADFCTLGNGLGIIGVAESSGLGELLASFPQLRALGEDGCIPPSIDVAITFPIINHAVTAWLLHHFGVDAEPVGLGPEVADAYDTPILIDSK